jgi:hypothetical protein
LATWTLRAAATRPPTHERRLVPAVDEPDAGLLNRNALPQQTAALIVSLWPPARQCVVRSVYAELPAPAVFLTALNVLWPARPAADARTLQTHLKTAFPPTETAVQVARAADAA